MACMLVAASSFTAVTDAVHVSVNVPLYHIIKFVMRAVSWVKNIESEVRK